MRSPRGWKDIRKLSRQGDRSQTDRSACLGGEGTGKWNVHGLVEELETEAAVDGWGLAISLHWSLCK